MDNVPNFALQAMRHSRRDKNKGEETRVRNRESPSLSKQKGKDNGKVSEPGPSKVDALHDMSNGHKRQRRDNWQSRSKRSPTHASVSNELAGDTSTSHVRSGNRETVSERTAMDIEEKVMRWDDGYISPENEYERCMQLPERQRRWDKMCLNNEEYENADGCSGY